MPIMTRSLGTDLILLQHIMPSLPLDKGCQLLILQINTIVQVAKPELISALLVYNDIPGRCCLPIVTAEYVPPAGTPRSLVHLDPPRTALGMSKI